MGPFTDRDRHVRRLTQPGVLYRLSRQRWYFGDHSWVNTGFCVEDRAWMEAQAAAIEDAAALAQIGTWARTMARRDAFTG